MVSAIASILWDFDKNVKFYLGHIFLYLRAFLNSLSIFLQLLSSVFDVKLLGVHQSDSSQPEENEFCICSWKSRTEFPLNY